MPPELSSPSLSSTTAPMGRSAASRGNCFRLSPMRVAGAAGAACRSFGSAMRVRRVSSAVETRLKFLLELVEHAVLQAPWRPALRAVAPLVGDGHAARIVHQHGDDVLLRLQLGDGDRRLPQQHQHHRRQERLQEPDRPQPASCESARAACGSRERIRPRQPGRRRQHSSSRTHFGQPPEGQTRPSKTSTRILEEKFKHSQTVPSSPGDPNSNARNHFSSDAQTRTVSPCAVRVPDAACGQCVIP